MRDFSPAHSLSPADKAADKPKLLSGPNIIIVSLVLIAHIAVGYSFTRQNIQPSPVIRLANIQGHLVAPVSKADPVQPVIEPESEAKPEPQPEPEPEPNPEPEPEPQPKPEPKPEPKSAPKPEPKPAAKPEQKIETEQEIKPEVTQETVSEASNKETETKPLPPRDEPSTALVPPHLTDANALNNPKPIYPRLSRRLREEGTVLLEILILADGSVGQIKLKSSSGFTRLDQTAKATVKRWRYQAARQNGQAIEYWYVQPIHFSLNNAKT